MNENYFKTIGKFIYYKDMSTKIYNTYTPASFQKQTSDKTEIQRKYKNILHLMDPLGREISSAGIF